MHASVWESENRICLAARGREDGGYGKVPNYLQVLEYIIVTVVCRVCAWDCTVRTIIDDQIRIGLVLAFSSTDTRTAL